MGYLLHNTGGHCDAAAGAKVSIVVCPSIRGRLPMVRDEVTTISTPGETVGVIVTERGIAVNDNLPDLKAELVITSYSIHYTKLYDDSEKAETCEESLFVTVCNPCKNVNRSYR